MSKIERIRGLIQTFSLRIPESSKQNMMWYKPDRNDINYVRLVPIDDDVDDSLYYDIWAELSLTETKMGTYQFYIKIVLYEGKFERTLMEETIANLHFDYEDGARQQTIINNWENSYVPSIKSQVSEYAGMASSELSAELE